MTGVIVDNQQDQINTLNSIVTEYKQYRDLNKELAKANKLDLSNLNKELTTAFKEDLNNKLDMEKSKYKLEIDKAINKEQVLEEKYNAIKIELENIKSINNN